MGFLSKKNSTRQYLFYLHVNTATCKITVKSEHTKKQTYKVTLPSCLLPLFQNKFMSLRNLSYENEFDLRFRTWTCFETEVKGTRKWLIVMAMPEYLSVCQAM